MIHTATNMTRTVSALTLAVTVAVVLTGCGDFLDINQNPNEATPEQLSQVPENLIPAAAAQLAVNKTVENQSGAFFAQTISGTGFGLFLRSTQYQIGGTTFNNTYLSNYETAIGNFTQVIDIAGNADPENVSYNPANVVAQAEILRQYTYLYETLFFGAVPFSQAAQPDRFPEPEPDPQEDILRGVIANLDSATANIDPSASGIGGDFFYSGDLNNWIRFANSVKLKAYFLLLSGEGSQTGAGVDGALPNGNDLQTEIENLLAEPLIRENSQNFDFPYADTETQENPVFAVSSQFSGGENVGYACGGELVDQMLAENSSRNQDPRLRIYCQEDQFDNSTFTGLPAGELGTNFAVETPENGWINESMVSDAIHRPTSPEEFATASEVLLKEAEWELRNGNRSAARQKLEEGIRKSIELLNTYPNVQNPISSSEIDNFIASLPSQSNLTVEDIQLQQWITLFERQIDVWTHWRRTKVPDLDPAAGAVTPNNIIPRRYDLPDAATSANPNLSGRQIITPMWFEGPSAN